MLLGSNCSIQAHKVDSLAPRVVGIPPSDAYIGLSILPNGEVRHYNYGEQAEAGSFYLSSKDGGHTWKKINISKDIPYADVQSPLSGEFVRMIGVGGMGTYVVRTNGGLNGGRTITKISDTLAIMCKPPVFLKKSGRVVVGAHYGLQAHLPKVCFTYVSTDDGKTWQRSSYVSTPDHTGGGIHQGKRWNHGAAEPSIIELNDGRLWMLIRTSQDCYYQSFSNDGGLTWQEATPSPFYGTITMPTLARLSDGCLLFVGSMSTPLPEVGNTNGVWEDVFTNRTVIHTAISDDDGKTWQGFRELYLDDRRNAADFASQAGMDKGLHQSQVVEVAPGKLLFSVGQHHLHRKLLLMDKQWLYAKDRKWTPSDSLDKWSTFSYLKGIKGHCGYNRLPGCTLTHEGIEIKRLTNDNVLSPQAGGVWNFPALRKGKLKISVRLKRGNDNGKLILNDRWFNPSDSTAALFAPYYVTLNRKTLKISDDAFHIIEIKWNIDCKDKKAKVFVDGKLRQRLHLNNDSAHGLFYLHLLSSTSPTDTGFVVGSVEANETE
ncbi:hypothetical protein Bache_2002 [Bacteroides helcogenes P 36-108]|uniref:Sialidase domain-containing protein n=2 Tax=Bacteroides helcogenes TaxID=290053 RepID=E6SQB7_BACT6|nr:hypothetical protein Bache_2002 [Bacteroides helcogenes P 36-108]